MAKKGSTGKEVTTEWAKHLRPFGKKEAAKCERKNAKACIEDDKKNLQEASMNKKFIKFLESLKDGKHNSLIESVKKGFQACCENEIGDVPVISDARLQTIVNFTPELSVVVSAENEDAFLEELEKRVNAFDKSTIKYEIEEGNEVDADEDPSFGSESIIYINSETPSLDVLVKTENPIDLLDLIGDQMSNCVSKNEYGAFSFNLVPKVAHEIKGNELRLRIFLDMDNDSIVLSKGGDDETSRRDIEYRKKTLFRLNRPARSDFRL